MDRIIVVGSTALNRTGVMYRTSDLDVWTNNKEIVTRCLPRADISEMSEAILNLVPVRGRDRDDILQYATIDAVYTIKCSHLGWDIFWNKHKRDVLYLKKIGAQLIEPLYTALVEHWKKEHGNKDFLSLYKDKTEFFNDFVEYRYDHDYLHELAAYPDKPIYTKCLKEDEDVAIDKSKFDKLSFKEQVKMFREEITVIATERWMIPHGVHWSKAYHFSLRKTVTSLTKNWATDFLIRNLEHFEIARYEDFNHIIKTLKEGEKQMTNQLTREEREILETEVMDAYYAITTHKYPYDNFNNLVPDMYYVKGIPNFEFVEQEGGGEGGAEYCYTVFKWKGDFYKIIYSYSSYGGYDYDYSQIYRVTPKEKTVTVYE